MTETPHQAPRLVADVEVIALLEGVQRLQGDAEHGEAGQGIPAKPQMSPDQPSRVFHSAIRIGRSSRARVSSVMTSAGITPASSRGKGGGRELGQARAPATAS